MISSVLSQSQLAGPAHTHPHDLSSSAERMKTTTADLPRANKRHSSLAFKSKSSSNVRKDVLNLEHEYADQDADDLDEDVIQATTTVQHSASAGVLSSSAVSPHLSSSSGGGSHRLSKSSGGMSGPTTPGGRGKGGIQQRAQVCGVWCVCVCVYVCGGGGGGVYVYACVMLGGWILYCVRNVCSAVYTKCA
jgi:uncharacterized membrane protein